jgi:hypothetical protein
MHFLSKENERSKAQVVKLKSIGVEMKTLRESHEQQLARRQEEFDGTKKALVGKEGG